MQTITRQKVADVRATRSFMTTTNDYAISQGIGTVGGCQRNNYLQEKEPCGPQSKSKVEPL